MSSKTEAFNADIEKRVKEGRVGTSGAVEEMLQIKLATAMDILTEERQRVTTREVKLSPHRDKEQRERLREITTLQIALTT